MSTSYLKNFSFNDHSMEKSSRLKIVFLALIRLSEYTCNKTQQLW